MDASVVIFVIDRHICHILYVRLYLNIYFFTLIYIYLFCVPLLA